VPDIGQQALNKVELAVFRATLVQLVPFIKGIARDGIPYTKIAIPQNGGQ